MEVICVEIIATKRFWHRYAKINVIGTAAGATLATISAITTHVATPIVCPAR